MERMISGGVFETGIWIIGAEQGLFLANGSWRPSFSALEARVTELVGGASRVLGEEVGADIAMTGILPTLSKSDVALGNITPKPRHHALNLAFTNLRGGEPYQLRIQGTDELHTERDSVMLQSCDTSFQVQPSEFAHIAAARDGLKAGFRWLDRDTFSAHILIREDVLPLVRSGLQAADVSSIDIDRYLAIIHDRVETGTSGSVGWHVLSWACNVRTLAPSA
jgi:hypothetical protein